MGMLTKILLLPVKGPLDGTGWIAGKIHEAAVTEINDPATLRQQLQALEGALLRGDLSEDDYDAAEEDLLIRLRAAST